MMKQGTALDILKAGRNVFLTGAPGAGKTYVLNEYIRYLREHGVSVAVTASTGIAATHIGGMTIHSWSGIGVKERLSEWDLDEITQKERVFTRFQRAAVLIIDEISMLKPIVLDSLDTLAQTIRGNTEPFGGMQVIFSGDFFQLPPVVKSSDDAGGGAFAYESPAWAKAGIRVCYLGEQFRQDDESFATILAELRSGELSEDSYEKIRARLNAELAHKTPTRLYTHNANVDMFNEEELEKLRGRERVYHLKAHGKGPLVDALVRNMLAPDVLRLKEGAAVMFVKNSPEGGYVNGTLGTVVALESDGPVVETTDKRRIYVSPAEWKIEEDGKVRAAVSQVPLRLAWAITVHKSQGMTLDAAEVDLSGAFVPGQGYVALSRVRSLEGLSLKGLNDMALRVDERIRRIDERMRGASQAWAERVEGTDRESIAKAHEAFITAKGGSLTPLPPEEQHEHKEEKVSTYDKTRVLLEEQHTIADIAALRMMTPNTIIGHMEHLRDEGRLPDISYMTPPKDDLEAIKKAIGKKKKMKLAQLHHALKGAFTYEELRFARLYV